MRFKGFNIHSTQYVIRNLHGFTLLELMVAFTIIGLLAVIIASALRVSLEAVDRADRRVDSLERLRTSINIINSQLQSQLPLTYEEEGEKRYYFKGDKESMRFSTNYSIWSGQSGYVLVKYEVISDEPDKKRLMAEENTIGIEKVMQTELFSGLDKIYFEYFYKGPTDEQGSWVEEWPDSSSLPEKIRLNISYEGSDFSMIIPVRTTGRITDLSMGRIFGEERPL